MAAPPKRGTVSSHKPNPSPVMLEDVQLIFPNFSGKAGRYNVKGRRNFNVILPDEVAQAMSADGWHIRILEPREEEEDEQPRPIIKVNVLYSERARPPRVVLISSRGKTTLDEDSISALDYVRIEKADLQFRPYVRGDDNEGYTVTAWLNAIYVTMEPDPLEEKYIDLPDSESAVAAMMSGHDEETPPF